jgi:ABC-type nitrate/sulfonate/bicarbonate transport system substrate-binding protein
MSLRPAVFALLTALPFVSATPIHAQTKLVVGMPTTPPNIVLMPLHVGKDLGFFKQEGIDIETVELEGGVKAFRAMVAGSVDIASSPGPFSIVGRAKGAATKMLVSNSPKLEVSMVVQKDIKSLAELKGKRIGIQEPGGFADVLARAVLREAKIDPKDVNFVSIMSEDVPPLVAKQIDSAILHIEQEMLAKQKAPDLHAIARLWELQPKQLYNVLVTQEKTIANRRAALEGFVKAHIKATRMMYTESAGGGQGLVRLPGEAVHLGRQPRPLQGADRLHHRRHGARRQHREGQGADLRQPHRPLVRRESHQGARRMERTAVHV